MSLRNQWTSASQLVPIWMLLCMQSCRASPSRTIAILPVWWCVIVFKTALRHCVTTRFARLCFLSSVTIWGKLSNFHILREADRLVQIGQIRWWVQSFSWTLVSLVLMYCNSLLLTGSSTTWLSWHERAWIACKRRFAASRTFTCTGSLVSDVFGRRAPST